MIPLGTAVRAAVAIEGGEFTISPGALGLSVKGVQLGHGWQWVRFAGTSTPMLVHGREIVPVDQAMIAVVTRASDPAIADVFVCDRGPCEWVRRGVSVPEAADSAVELAGDTGYPVFWNGAPYLDASLPEAVSA